MSSISKTCVNPSPHTSPTHNPSFLYSSSQAMDTMISQLDKSSLRPMQKESYLCMSKCCDTSPTPNQLQQCCQQCERKVVSAQQTINATLRDFQDRLGRCVQRCQDVAQEGLSPSSSDKDVAKAQVRRMRSVVLFFLGLKTHLSSTYSHNCFPSHIQDKLANCAANCAEEYERQIPKVQKDLTALLKRINTQ